MNLVLSLTERCNLRCAYCYYKVSHEARSLVMKDDVMEAAIRLAFERTLSLGQRFLNVFPSLFLQVISWDEITFMILTLQVQDDTNHEILLLISSC